MESTLKSRGKERTQKQNAKYPLKKDLSTNSSAHGDGATTTQGQDQRSHKDSHARPGILTSPTYFEETGETTRQVEGPSHCGLGKAESLMEKENLKKSRRDGRRDIGRKNEIF